MFDKKVDIAQRYNMKPVKRRRVEPIPKLTPHPFNKASRSTLRTTSARMQSRIQKKVSQQLASQKNYQERLGKWYKDNL